VELHLNRKDGLYPLRALNQPSFKSFDCSAIHPALVFDLRMDQMMGDVRLEVLISECYHYLAL